MIDPDTRCASGKVVVVMLRIEALPPLVNFATCTAFDVGDVRDADALVENREFVVGIVDEVAVATNAEGGTCLLPTLHAATRTIGIFRASIFVCDEGRVNADIEVRIVDSHAAGELQALHPLHGALALAAAPDVRYTGQQPKVIAILVDRASEGCCLHVILQTCSTREGRGGHENREKGGNTSFEHVHVDTPLCARCASQNHNSQRTMRRTLLVQKKERDRRIAQKGPFVKRWMASMSTNNTDNIYNVYSKHTHNIQKTKNA